MIYDKDKPLQFEQQDFEVIGPDGCHWDDLEDLIYIGVLGGCGCGHPDYAYVHAMSMLKRITDNKELKDERDYFTAYCMLSSGIITKELELTVLGEDVLSKFQGEFNDVTPKNETTYTPVRVDEEFLEVELSLVGITDIPSDYLVPVLSYIVKVCGYYEYSNSRGPRTLGDDWNEFKADVEKILEMEYGSGEFYYVFHQLDRLGIEEHGGSSPGWIAHGIADEFKDLMVKFKQWQQRPSISL